MSVDTSPTPGTPVVVVIAGTPWMAGVALLAMFVGVMVFSLRCPRYYCASVQFADTMNFGPNA